MANKSLPSSGPVNPKSQGCWFCGELPVVEHHLIPQQYGGIHGPTTWICPNCHKNIHALESTIGNRPYNDPFVRDLIGQMFFYVPVQKLCFVNTSVKILTEARDLIKNDPNKSVVFTDRFPAEVNRQLTKLRSVYPTLNRQKIVRLAIRLLHDKHFIGN